MGSDRGAFDTQFIPTHLIDFDMTVCTWIFGMQVASFETIMPSK
jgi:hypothetical protein